MIWVSAQEAIALHDRILQRFPGVAGLSDPGRAQALIYRVQNRVHYEGVTDLFELAATYWVAIARGRIFHDGNKRTAFFVTMTFLWRNGIRIVVFGWKIAAPPGKRPDISWRTGIGALPV